MEALRHGCILASTSVGMHAVGSVCSGHPVLKQPANLQPTLVGLLCYMFVYSFYVGPTYTALELTRA